MGTESVNYVYSGVALRWTAKVEQSRIFEMFSVYAIYSELCGKCYVGQTINLSERLKQHNLHTFRGYTSRFPGEWVLIYNESVATRSEALVREKQLKSGNGRLFIQSFIPDRY